MTVEQREEKKRKIRRLRTRKKSRKFIPDSDSDFARMARSFRNAIARNPSAYNLREDDVAAIDAPVSQFRDALARVTAPSTRTSTAIIAKDEARQRAEAVVRKYGRLIRVDESISPADKVGVGMRERPNKLRERKCPQEQPIVKFVGADPKHPGMHILKWQTEKYTSRTAKPFGAARLELFVEHVPPGRAVPRTPSELSGRSWYLRSFTSSPMKVAFPQPPAESGPMLVVYWARWADAKGEVGPFSQTIVARVEGWAAAFPGSVERAVSAQCARMAA